MAKQTKHNQSASAKQGGARIGEAEETQAKQARQGGVKHMRNRAVGEAGIGEAGDAERSEALAKQTKQGRAKNRQSRLNISEAREADSK